MAKDSMFDNPRFADEANQPGINPAIPDIQPVVDKSDAVALESAGNLLTMGLDLKDMYTIESLRKDFESVEEGVESSDSGLRDRYGKAIRERDVETMRKVENELSRLSLAEKQGVLFGSKHAVKIRQAELVRKAISDSPWLAADIRSVASAYSVSGLGGSGTDSPNDPFIDTENEIIQSAYRLNLLGVPVEARAELIRFGITKEQQWQTLQTRDKGQFLMNAQNHMSFKDVELRSRLTTYYENTPPLSVNPAEVIAIVEEAKAREVGNIMANYHRQAGTGQSLFPLTTADAKSLVDSQFDFYLKLAEAQDPLKIIQRRNEIMKGIATERIALGDSLVSKFVMGGADLGEAMEASDSIMKIVDKFGPDALNNPSVLAKLDPSEKAMLELFTSVNSIDFNRGFEMAAGGWARGELPGGAFGAKMAQVFAGQAVAKGPQSQVAGAWDAWKTLNESVGNLDLDVVLKWTPSDIEGMLDKEGRGMAPQVFEGLNRKMENIEIGAFNSLHGPDMFGFGSSIFNLTNAEKRWSLQYDEKRDWFVVVDSKGELLDPTLQGHDVVRQVNGLNKVYQVRKKFGMWNGKGSYQSRAEWIDWVTKSASVATSDDAGLTFAGDRAFTQEAEKVKNPLIRHTIIESEGGYQNNASDRGNWTGGSLGVGKNVGTNMGITPATLAAYRGVDISTITAEDMKGLKPEEVEKIYEANYFTGPGIDKLPSDNLKGIVFDMGVVMGPRKAISLMQQALGVTADGKIGPETLFAARNVDLNKLRDMYRSYFKTVARRGENQKFLRGWMRRVDNTFAAYTDSSRA